MGGASDSPDDLDALAMVLANQLREVTARFLDRTDSSSTDRITNLRRLSDLLGGQTPSRKAPPRAPTVMSYIPVPPAPVPSEGSS